jgi:hypothetical protein
MYKNDPQLCTCLVIVPSDGLPCSLNPVLVLFPFPSPLAPIPDPCPGTAFPLHCCLPLKVLLSVFLLVPLVPPRTEEPALLLLLPFPPPPLAPLPVVTTALSVDSSSALDKVLLCVAVRSDVMNDWPISPAVSPPRYMNSTASCSLSSSGSMKRRLYTGTMAGCAE